MCNDMAITVTGFDYDVLAADAVHIKKDDLNTPYDGAVTTYAEIRMIKQGEPVISRSNTFTPVRITWDGGGVWNGYTQGVTQAAADPDRKNIYTGTAMDAMGVLNNTACTQGGVYSLASLANVIKRETDITLLLGFDEMPVFSIDHLMPEDDGEFPTYGKILRELGTAMGVTFFALTSSVNTVVHSNAGSAISTPNQGQYPGTTISLREMFNSVCANWSMNANGFTEFEVVSESGVSGTKIKYSGATWSKYHGKYVTLYRGAISAKWAYSGSAGYIGKVRYGDEDKDEDRHMASDYYVGVSGRSTRLNILGEFIVKADIFINPSYVLSGGLFAGDADVPNVPLLWMKSRTEVDSRARDKSVVYIQAGDLTLNPTAISSPTRLNDSGWIQVNYTFRTDSLTVEQLSDMHLCVGSRYLVEGPDNDDGTGGRGYAFAKGFELIGGENKDGISLTKNVGKYGKSFKLDTSFFANNTGVIAQWIPGLILNAPRSTEEAMTAIANRLSQRMVEKTMIIDATSYPQQNGDIKSYDYDVANNRLTFVKFI